MKLPTPFIKLPYKFDVERLRDEISQFSDSEWQSHPQGYSGNSAIRLVSHDGGENDDVHGAMMPTLNLERCPYIQQVLAFFGVVVSRSRLMRLAPGGKVPAHSDTNYHWFNRIRIHIPIITTEDVLFHCDSETVNMQAGDTWLFDNWRMHSVENNSDIYRVHLVIDTVGSSAFWDVANYCADLPENELKNKTKLVPYNYYHGYELMTERDCSSLVMHPEEMQYLANDLLEDITVKEPHPESNKALAHFRKVVNMLVQDWRMVWVRYGNDLEQLGVYQQLLERTLAGIDTIPLPVIMKSNGIAAKNVLTGRIFQGAINKHLDTNQGISIDEKIKAFEIFDRPIFIVGAPRSGSTFLYETLSKCEQLLSIGGESHAVIEGNTELDPSFGIVDSNRLTDTNATKKIEFQIKKGFAQQLIDFESKDQIVCGRKIRFLEKTPKNSLRIPFILKLFPDAKFIYLYREPKQNISSIIEAWKSGKWITYAKLPDRDNPWSLLLPPGWKDYSKSPLEKIAAFQWSASNEFIMDDLKELPRERVHCINYDDLVEDTVTEVQKICEFADLEFSESYRKTLSEPLPESKYTLTSPKKDKWKKNEELLRKVEDIYSKTEIKYKNFS